MSYFKKKDPLDSSVRINDFEMVKKYLVEADVKRRTSAFYSAIHCGHSEIASYIASLGLEANIDYEQLLYSAIRSGDVSTVELIGTMSRFSVTVADMWKSAIESYSVEMAKFLFERGYRPDNNGSVIEQAMKIGSKEIAKYLIGLGYGFHHNNFSAFWRSVRVNDSEMINFFIEHGAMIDIRETPFVLKKDYKNIPCFTILKNYPHLNALEIAVALIQEIRTKHKNKVVQQLNLLVSSYPFLSKQIEIYLKKYSV